MFSSQAAGQVQQQPLSSKCPGTLQQQHAEHEERTRAYSGLMQPNTWTHACSDTCVLHRCAGPGEANVTKLATKFGSQAATTQRVRINPVQFHFHTRSEHVLDGEPRHSRATTVCQSDTCLHRTVQQQQRRRTMAAVSAACHHVELCISWLTQ